MTLSSAYLGGLPLAVGPAAAPAPTPAPAAGTQTAIDLITRAMRLAKILAVGEVPNAAEAQDGLATLNDVLENWDTEPLSLWSSANFVGATVAGQATYTIGPGGDLNTVRPSAIQGAYVTFSGVDFPVDPIGQLEFNGYALKSFQQPIPQKLLYVNDWPLGRITLWPVPSQAMPLVLTFNRVLTSVPNVSTPLSYPPGALKALRYTLAIELATEYGSPVDAVLIALARDAKADYKRANRQPVLASYDSSLTGYGPGVNWRTGV